jgi:hypothetical protein
LDVYFYGAGIASHSLIIIPCGKIDPSSGKTAPKKIEETLPKTLGNFCS